MQIGGATSSIAELSPPSRGRQRPIPHESVQPVDPGYAAGFTTARHPYVRVETAIHFQGSGGFVESGAPPPLAGPPGAYLAQAIAQERLGPGLTLSQSEKGARAYRQADRPLVPYRAGSTVDVAA